ncbi:unnamed protein product [Chrysodeixis includens]|uniref:Odorant receptor n=1 Tax=Chrysodeixis includens TaxID=689277 RepID=A0A9N8KYU4_CHRIL|nr:unnamed protein product [Chrysodeixis includens]
MDEDLEFKPFHDSYKMITFALSIGMIYPNPKTEKWRLASIPLLVATIAPLAINVFIDMYRCWMIKDIVNIIRHSTVMGPFLGGFFKMILMYHKRIQAKQILDEIDRDHFMFNTFSDKYKDIARSWIRNSQIYSERGWVITVTGCVMTFPVMAIVQNVYNFAFKSEPEKFMIHDVDKPFSESEARFESPYFECMFIYQFYASILYVVNFIGYDGFFGLSINHACMKMDLYCTALEDAMRSEKREVCGRVVAVIKEQCRMFRYVDLIQDTFNIWLGIIFIATMIQICTCLYHITEGYGFDLRYMIFVTGAVIHIYLPCRYAAKLKALYFTQTACRFYSCGWEHVDSQCVRKMLSFMIARAQAPQEITAFNMMAFDMELFLSVY